jgi:hypothetical protein
MTQHLQLPLNKSEAQALRRMLMAVPMGDRDAGASDKLTKRLVMAMHKIRWPVE